MDRATSGGTSSPRAWTGSSRLRPSGRRRGSTACRAIANSSRFRSRSHHRCDTPEGTRHLASAPSIGCPHYIRVQGTLAVPFWRVPNCNRQGCLHCYPFPPDNQHLGGAEPIAHTRACPQLGIVRNQPLSLNGCLVG